MELTKEQMFRAYDEAPEVVRKALQPEGLAMLFVDEIADKYKLHVDVAGLISVLIRNMILGFISPSEFRQKLRDAGVAEPTARQLLVDLNSKVFVPLRNQVRSQGSTYPSQPPQVPILNVSQPSLVPEAISISKPDSSTPPYNLINKVIPSKPVPPKVSVPAVSLSAASIPVPTMRTMQHDMELVQHGSMPAPYPVAAAQLHPAQATPARSFQTASVPVTIPPVQPQPIPEMVHIVPDTAPQAASPTPQINPTKEFTSDPYREPI